MINPKLLGCKILCICEACLNIDLKHLMSKAKVDERVVIDSNPFYIGIFVKDE